jgi:hypothetical protein
VLRGPAPDLRLAGDLRRLEIRDEALDRDRAAAVRRHHPPGGGIAPGGRLAASLHRLRELVEHREHRHALELAVAHHPRLDELGEEDAGRLALGLRRDEDEEPLGVRQEAAADLADDAVGVGHRRDLVQLVDQHARRLDAGEDARVERLDLEDRLRLAVDDLLQVLARLEALLQEALVVRVDHAHRLAEGEVGDHLGRADEQELGARPLVEQQRRHHQRGAVARLRVLLRYQREDLADEPLARYWIEAAEERPHDVAEPLAGRVREARLALDVGQPQLVEDAHRALGLVGEERQVGDQRAPRSQSRLPVRAGEAPRQWRISPQPVPCSAPSAAMAACSFLPSVLRLLGRRWPIGGDVLPGDQRLLGGDIPPLRRPVEPVELVGEDPRAAELELVGEVLAQRVRIHADKLRDDLFVDLARHQLHATALSGLGDEGRPSPASLGGHENLELFG